MEPMAVDLPAFLAPTFGRPGVSSLEGEIFWAQKPKEIFELLGFNANPDRYRVGWPSGSRLQCSPGRYRLLQWPVMNSE